MTISGPRRALDLLWAGKLTLGPEWAAAHAICQEAEGARDHDLVHALCHWIELDLGNRDYWYARAAPWRRAATLTDEWHAISATLT